jgi:putative ABC transport system permease protein
MPRPVRALDRKLVRDLRRVAVQAIAIAALLGCGVAVFVASVATWRALARSQARYYEAYRFAAVFAEARRAPEQVAGAIAALPGVAEVETRVVASAAVELPGGAFATARALSVGPEGARLNRTHLRAGRGLARGAADEALVSEGFALANGLEPGAGLDVTVNGRRQRLRVVGVAISPETVYAIRPGEIFPDDRHYGILWAPREALAAAMDAEGAFNEVSLTLAPGASEREVIAGIDRLLRPWGGLGAYGRERHVSHRFLSDEIHQLETMAAVLPPIFLGVAAFLVSVVLSRLVRIQRQQIGTLRAIGYSAGEVGAHYAKLVAIVALAGCALGVGGGTLMAAGLARTYADFFRLPALALEREPGAVALSAAIALAAALAGALGAVRAAVRLAPAEAMRPAPPPTYRPTFVERLGVVRLLPPSGRMVLRDLGRRPTRALLAALGLAFAVGILVVAWFAEDAVDLIFDRTLVRAQRQDATVTFTHALSEDALVELRALDGVLRVEGFLSVPAVLRAGHRSYATALTGVERGADLTRIVGADGTAVPLPAAGLVLSSKLAETLGVGRGGAVTAEVLDGRRPVRTLRVVAVVDDFLGVQATSERGWLAATLGDAPLVSGAHLAVDAPALRRVEETLARAPAVAGVTARAATLAAYRRLVASFLLTYVGAVAALAFLIAVGVVYNSARVTWAERERELATLRVLGFTRGEIWRIVAGETATHLAAAIPAGWAIGLAAVVLTASRASTDLYRIPATVARPTYALAAVAVAGAVLAVLLVAVRWVRRQDLVEVLKSRE